MVGKALGNDLKNPHDLKMISAIMQVKKNSKIQEKVKCYVIFFTKTLGAYLEADV